MVNRVSELLRSGGVIPPYQSGFFISPALSDVNGTGIFDLATSLVVPINIETTTNFDGVAIRSGTTLGYTNWKFGLYTIKNTLSPALGDAVIEATSLTAGGTSVNTTHAFSSTQVARGTYWMALASQGGSGNIAVVNNDTLDSGTLSVTNMTGGIDISSGTSASGSFQLTGDSAAASTTFASQDIRWPIMGLRVA